MSEVEYLREETTKVGEMILGTCGDIFSSAKRLLAICSVCMCDNSVAEDDQVSELRGRVEESYFFL